MSSSSSSYFKLTSAEVKYIIPVVVCAVISMMALVSLAVRVALALLRPGSAANPAREHIFFRTQLGLFAGCLLLSNFIASLSGLMEAVWISRGAIMEGPACTTQATLMVIGDFSSAFFTAVIAIHTFNSLVMRFKQPVWVNVLIVTIGWTAAFLSGILLIVTHRSDARGPVYGNTTFACGITSEYPFMQFLSRLLPVFLTVLISAVLYSLIFLVLRGTLSIRGGLHLSLDPRHRWNAAVHGFEEYQQFLGAIAWSMLWYPLAYFVLLLPFSVALLLSISGFDISWGFMVFAMTLASLLGLLNVVLIYNTLRVLTPAIVSKSLQTLKMQDGERSFASFDSEKPVPRFTTTPPSAGVQDSFRRPSDAYVPALPTMRNLTPGVVPYLTRTDSNASSSRALIRPSLHRVSMSQSSISSIARSISPISQLNMELDSPEAAHMPTHHRQNSSESVNSLPPPPRKARALRREPSVDALPPTRMMLGPGGAMVFDDALAPAQRARNESITEMYMARNSVMQRAGPPSARSSRSHRASVSEAGLLSPMSETGVIEQSPFLGSLMHQQSAAPLPPHMQPARQNSRSRSGTITAQPMRKPSMLRD